jgi:hypothetical protein
MSSANFESLSKQFDIIREAIIANFRDRIQAGKRSRLTKQELEELIDIFITRLQSLDDADLIERLCDREIALLEEGYPAATVAKNYLPKYRQAIASAIEEQRIILNERNSHSYTYFKNSAEHLTTEHWALTYLKYDRADYEEFARSTIANNNLKQDSLKAVNPVLYLEAVDSLLDSSQPLDLAIAIAATTGRRYSEVMAKGVFEATEHPYQIHFAGQLKKRTAHAPSQGAGGRSKQGGLRDDSYTIYTLVPAERVVTALERFRTHPDLAGLENASIEKINQLNTPINRLVKHYFQDTDLVPILKGEAGVTIQNLRGIYGEIAIHFFCPQQMGVHRFIQQKLGHLIGESDLASSKNSGSTEHYFHYYLVDSKGKQVASKGIKLEPLSSSNNGNSGSKEAKQVEQLEITTDDQRSEKADFTEQTLSTSHDSEPNSESLSKSDDGKQKKAVLISDRSWRSEADRSVRPSADRLLENEPTTIPEKVASGLDFSTFLTMIHTLIDSDDYRHLLVGLMANSGLDAASLLKLLVFKKAAAPHLILYSQQLHPPHQPLQQLLTLGNATHFLDAIARLRHHPDAIDFAHRLTGSEINSAVAQFIPDLLQSSGLQGDLDLARQYQDFLPLLFTENLGDLSQTAKSDHEVLPSADRSVPGKSNESLSLASLSPDTSSSLDSSLAPNSHPWLIISRLTETISNLSDRLMQQNERLIELQFSAASPSSLSPGTTHFSPKDPNKEQHLSEKNLTPSREIPLSNLENLKSLSSEELRTSRARGVAAEKLRRALDAVITYNQQQPDSQSRWRINTRVLQQLTGCFNAHVKTFVQQHQQLINDHNQHFGLTSSRHNSLHSPPDPNSQIHW